MQNFYNSFRPHQFGQVMGQDQSLTILKRQAINRNFSHSYLFHGPSGTGKTTTARILAMALCCEHMEAGEPCGKCINCGQIIKGSYWDVAEINVANFRGVDDVRSLCYKAYLSPFGPYKVFILDEVHMLTKEAANCLLKLLEEPPERCVFILCTTDISTLPETLLSRCAQFKFNKLESVDIRRKLDYVCSQIKIDADKKYLDFIAESAQGNCRSAEGLLEQVVCLQTV